MSRPTPNEAQRTQRNRLQTQEEDKYTQTQQESGFGWGTVFAIGAAAAVGIVAAQTIKCNTAVVKGKRFDPNDKQNKTDI